MSEMHAAIQTAIATVKDIYKDEEINDVELEEIEFDDNHWFVTVGFSRNKGKGAFGLMLPVRTLKIVKVNRLTGNFDGMTIRNPGI